MTLWLVTGVSSGLGLHVALKALEASQKVIGTVRSRSKSAVAVAQIEEAGGQVYELDMTSGQAAEAERRQYLNKVQGKGEQEPSTPSLAKSGNRNPRIEEEDGPRASFFDSLQTSPKGILLLEHRTSFMTTVRS